MLALGLLGPITRALSGTYRCKAANDQGEAVKDVTLTVECEWGCAGCISIWFRIWGVASFQGRVGVGYEVSLWVGFGKGKRLVSGVGEISWRVEETGWACP